MHPQFLSSSQKLLIIFSLEPVTFPAASSDEVDHAPRLSVEVLNWSNMDGLLDRCIAPCTRGTWVTCWSPEDDRELSERVLALKHRDFRDLVPPSMQEIQETYREYVRDGHWTVGLFEMWAPKAKHVKHAVHIPCWTSFRVLPWLWRGAWLGKTWNECLWTGWRQMRWSRAAYSGALGREYIMPVYDVGHHGYSSDIRALCGLSCAMACVLSCGIGQILSLCGNAGANFGSLYTCNARRKVRSKFKLPPAIPCCFPGVDDCLVDFFCFYCASHQMLRELAIRGVDGPGMHVLDVAPEAFGHVPGIKKAVNQRRLLVERMTALSPRFFRTRPANESKRSAIMSRLDQAFVASAINVTDTLKGAVLLQNGELEHCHELGWSGCMTSDSFVAPAQLSMQRTNSDVVSGWSALSKQEVSDLFGVARAGDARAGDARAGDARAGDARPDDETGATPLLQRAWSVAY